MDLELLTAGAGVAAAASAAFNAIVLLRRALRQAQGPGRRRPAALALGLLSSAAAAQGALWAAGPAGPLDIWPAALPALRAGAALALAAGSLAVSAVLLRRVLGPPKGPSLPRRCRLWPR